MRGPSIERIGALVGLARAIGRVDLADALILAETSSRIGFPMTFLQSVSRIEAIEAEIKAAAAIASAAATAVA